MRDTLINFPPYKETVLKYEVCKFTTFLRPQFDEGDKRMVCEL